MGSGFLQRGGFELGACGADCSGRRRNADLRWRHACARAGVQPYPQPNPSPGGRGAQGPAVRVNCISPGWIATEAWRKPSARRKPALSRQDHAQHPAGRVGTPQDIGALAVCLLSEAAGLMTGQEVVVDGGMTRKMLYA